MPAARQPVLRPPSISTVELRDGRRVSIRPISAADPELLRGLFDHLSERSRYQRFLSYVSEQSDDERRRLTDVDHHLHEAVIAIARGGEMVGVARYIRLADTTAAEVAVTIVDDWQGDGLGGVLLNRLADGARRDGVQRFTALLLESNRAMMTLFRRLGPVEVIDRGSGSIEIEIGLTSEAPERKPHVFDRVLVAYEGSDHSDDALALAKLLAGEGAQITAACAYWYEARSWRVGPGSPEMMRVDADEALARLRERDAEIELRHVRGPTPAAALHDLTEDERFDLVVVGSTRRGQLGRVVSGTTATTLLHGSPCAVAVAPAGYRDVPVPSPPRIGVAYDGSPTSRVALDVARDLAAAHGASLAVLDAYDTIPAYAMAGDALPADVDVHGAAQAELDKALAACRGVVEAHGELLEGRPTDALLARAKDLDLLVAGSRGYGRVRGVVLGSMSRRLAEESPCPLLVVPQAPV